MNILEQVRELVDGPRVKPRVCKRCGGWWTGVAQKGRKNCHVCYQRTHRAYHSDSPRRFLLKQELFHRYWEMLSRHGQTDEAWRVTTWGFHVTKDNIAMYSQRMK